MKWTLTTKTQTYGVGAEVGKYEIRVTRTGNTVRVSFGNLNVVFTVDEAKTAR